MTLTEIKKLVDESKALADVASLNTPHLNYLFAIFKARKLCQAVIELMDEVQRLRGAGNNLNEKLESFCGCNYDEQCDTCYETDCWDKAIAESRERLGE